jgi:hypothetical protein
MSMRYRTITSDRILDVLAGAEGQDRVKEVPSERVRCDRCGWTTLAVKPYPKVSAVCLCGGTLRVPS